MPPKIASLLSSRRFWASAASYVFTITEGAGLELSPQLIALADLVVGFWVMGDSFKKTGASEESEIDRAVSLFNEAANSIRRLQGAVAQLGGSKSLSDFTDEEIHKLKEKLSLMNPKPTPKKESAIAHVVPLLILSLSVVTAGCNTLKSLPQGTQLQSSTFGLRVAPGDPAGTPLTLGSHSTIVTTSQPADAGANLNRFQAEAPLGVNIRSTVATGAVGEQLREAGGPQALQQLLGNTVSSDEWEPVIDLGEPDEIFQLPRTDLTDEVPPLSAPEPREANKVFENIDLLSLPIDTGHSDPRDGSGRGSVRN